MKIAVGAFLVAHGLVHLVYYIPAQDPDFPMTASKSWLLDHTQLPLGAIKPLVAALAAAALLGFIALALIHWGALPAEWFRLIAVGSAALSLALIAITWDKTFVVGAAINVGVIYWALTS